MVHTPLMQQCVHLAESQARAGTYAETYARSGHGQRGGAALTVEAGHLDQLEGRRAEARVREWCQRRAADLDQGPDPVRHR